MNEIEVKLRNIISKTINNIVDIDKIGPEHNLRKFGLNSLGFVKVVVGIENEFGIEFEDDDLEITNYESLNELMKYIEKKRLKNCQ